MMVSKWPWRKPPRPEKGAVICTRLILPAVFPAVKKYGFQRGSVRTICSCKDLSRTAKGGARSVLIPVPIHAPPVQADESLLLTKFNGGCCSNTCPRQSSKQTHNSNKKRMRPVRAASSDYLLGSILVHFQQDLE